MENGNGMQVLHKRDRQQALDELNREFGVRARCFPRWIADGRVSATDAQDRLDRLATAIEIVAHADSDPEVVPVRT